MREKVASDMINPKVSIITVCLNSISFLEDTLRSVREQTYSNIEYIVIDGGSKDGTKEIIKKHEIEIDYWVSEPDHGISDAFNKGVMAATGDIIAFLNSQDYYAGPEVIAKVMKLFAEHPETSIVYGKTCYVPADSNEIVGIMGERFERRRMLIRNIMPHQSVFMKNYIFKEFGLYDHNYKYAMDYEHLLRVTEVEKPLFTDELLAVMRLGGISDTDKFAVCTELFLAQRANGVSLFHASATLFYHYLTSAGLKALRLFRFYTLGHFYEKIGLSEQKVREKRSAMRNILNKIKCEIRKIYVFTTDFFWFIESVFYRGSTLTCPLCCRSFKRMKPFKGSFSLHGIITDHFTADALCPRCRSDIRHRLAFTFLKKTARVFDVPLKLLHFAPERCLSRAIECEHVEEYVKADILPEQFVGAVKVDITNIPFPSGTFDGIIAIHVLEHISDDLRAIAELCRVLKPGGWALVAVPIYGEFTQEGEGMTFSEREKKFGTGEHMRMYGLDCLRKLEQPGFVVKTVSSDEIPGNYMNRDVVTAHTESDRFLFFCTKI